jgi:Ca-activated chloride channel family protein
LQLGSAEVVVKVASLVLGALTLAVPATFAQSPAPAQATASQSPVFRSGSALVALNVTVQDSGARFVSGLQPDDFAVYEDGVKQDVRFFESAAVPIDLIVLLDMSSSMNDKLDVVHEAASGFLKTLRDGDRGAVVGFSDTVQVLQPLTSDRALLDKAVRSTGAKGSTSLNNAVYIAIKQFGQSTHAGADVRRQAIVVLSDGEDTSSLVSFDDVLAQARKSGVNVYTVSLHSKYEAAHPEFSGRRYFSDADQAMKLLARETGAQSFFPSPASLKTVYGAIANELASQYSIGYAPANTRADGRFRRVVVQVVTRPELHPRTRPGYTAEGFAVAAANNSGNQQPR